MDDYIMKSGIPCFLLWNCQMDNMFLKSGIDPAFFPASQGYHTQHVEGDSHVHWDFSFCLIRKKNRGFLFPIMQVWRHLEYESYDTVGPSCQERQYYTPKWMAFCHTSTSNHMFGGCKIHQYFGKLWFWCFEPISKNMVQSTWSLGSCSLGKKFQKLKISNHFPVGKKAYTP